MPTKNPAYIAAGIILLVLGTIGSSALAWFALTSPGPASTRALLSVKSSDGTTIWLGLFRSCALIAQGRLTCTPFSFNPTYNFSVLGEGAPIEVFDTPAPFLRALVWLVSVNSVAVLPVMFWIILRQEIKAMRPPKSWDMGILLIIFTMEMFTSVVGALTFWFLHLLYEKTAQHFNVFTTLLGRTDLIAYTGNSFQLGYGAYSLVAFAWLAIATECHFVSVEPDSNPDEKASAGPPGPPGPPVPPTPSPPSLIQMLTNVANSATTLVTNLAGSTHPTETPVSPPGK